MDSLGQFKDFFRGRIDKGVITDMLLERAEITPRVIVFTNEKSDETPN